MILARRRARTPRPHHLLSVLLGFACVGAGPAQQPLDDVAFLTGCWQGSFGDGGTIEEHYTSPATNIMLGTTRYLRDRTAVEYEFTLIEATAEGLILTPYPNGRRSPDSFVLTTVEASGRVIFEAPEHDYPKRISYAPQDDGSVQAQIDGGTDDTDPRGWHLRPVACMPDA